MSDTWKNHKQVCVGKLPTEKTETWENTKYNGIHRTHVKIQADKKTIGAGLKPVPTISDETGFYSL